MSILNLKLITPEKVVLEKEITSLTCPTPLGEITILPKHAQLVATLIPGEIHAKTQNEDFFLHVSGGFVEVKQGNKVVILADAAEHAYEIDKQRAEEAKIRAEDAIKESKLAGEEYAKVASALERSMSRIKIHRKYAHRKTPITSEGVYKE